MPVNAVSHHELHHSRGHDHAAAQAVSELSALKKIGYLMSMRRQIARIRKSVAVGARRPEAVTDPFRSGPDQGTTARAGRRGGGEL
jgi:hypothetical protein